ncbi:MAG: adenylate cyclase [Gammaproteobacteria bacterium]|jgi:adenylate cyclase
MEFEFRNRVDKSLEKLAVLFADISGSTRLYEQYGDVVARADLGACIQLLANICAGMDGETIKTIGDEIMCAFDDPIKAALTAAEMQAGLRKASEEGQYKMGVLHIKVGWHYGLVSWRGEELIGEAPIAAQQVIGRAKADEILTSRQSIKELPPAMFPTWHTVDRIESEAWDGELEVCKIPWEQTGEETQISAIPMSQLMPKKAGLKLEYNGTVVSIDADNTRCTIGRGRNANLIVNGNFTSRQHAEITYRNGRFSLRDESVNGIVIIDDSGNVKRLRREEDVLTGSGMIGFGASPVDDPTGAVRFDCT